MPDKNDYLITEEIQNTINKLYLRINDRFPKSGLSRLCKTLHDNSLETDRSLKWIEKPIYSIRILAYAIIFGIAFATVYSITISKFSVNTNISELIQVITSVLEGAVIVCAAIIFIITFENKRKRTKIISSINKLRCIAHIVDMHQLTKDPEIINNKNVSTVHSPKRELTKFELSRYLNYCTEMLSLISKLGFLFIQKFPDTIATEAVNDLEELVTGLSRKIWQKIVLLDTKNS